MIHWTIFKQDILVQIISPTPSHIREAHSIGCFEYSPQQATLCYMGTHIPQKGAQALPNFRPMSIVAKRSPISAIAELLLMEGNVATCMLYDYISREA